METSKKVQPIGNIESIVTGYRQRGQTIVFTNGCFDLLHVGHARYLQQARSYGDYLVVGVNSDRSVKTLKGEMRPVVNQDYRAELLAALESVSLVVIFDELDPLRLISLVKPDILVKGADWGSEHIIGREFVEQNGGQVIRLPLVPEMSTTHIINTILDRFGQNEQHRT
ncbi:MAG: D-glycero-beta-D-manno-heptose 1-phosphate adenylyltransferase [bacterium]